MFKKIRQSQLFKDSAIYTFGALFQRGVSYLLIPVYMGVLTTGEFGELEFLNTLAFLLSILFSIGLPQVILTEFYHTKKEVHFSLFKNIGISYLIVSIPLYLVFFIFFVIWGNSLFNVNLSKLNILLTVLYSFLLFFQSIYFSVLRLTFRSFQFMLLNVLSGILLGGVNILLVYFYQFGITGILITSSIITGTVSFIGYFNLRKRGQLLQDVQLKESKKLLLIGAPFMVSSVAHWFATFADRWIILKTLTKSDLGIYSIAYKFSAIYDALIINPLVSAYTPYLFKKFSNKRYYIPYHLIIPGTIILFIGLIFVSRFALTLFAKGDYVEAIGLVPYLVMGFAFSFIAQITACVLIYFKKTKQLVYNIIAAGIMNIILNFILISNFQLLGSAYAFLFSYVLWSLLTLFQSVIIIRNEKNRLLSDNSSFG